MRPNRNERTEPMTTTALLRLQTSLLLRLARNDDGQATAEYALVLLGAAAVALLVVGWATKTNAVGRLLDAVFGQLIGKSGGK
jgi:Flp pilus assembly pilin Flp